MNSNLLASALAIVCLATSVYGQSQISREECKDAMHDCMKEKMESKMAEIEPILQECFAEGGCPNPKCLKDSVKEAVQNRPGCQADFSRGGHKHHRHGPPPFVMMLLGEGPGGPPPGPPPGFGGGRRGGRGGGGGRMLEEACDDFEAFMGCIEDNAPGDLSGGFGGGFNRKKRQSGGGPFGGQGGPFGGRGGPFGRREPPPEVQECISGLPQGCEEAMRQRPTRADREAKREERRANKEAKCDCMRNAIEDASAFESDVRSAYLQCNSNPLPASMDLQQMFADKLEKKCNREGGRRRGGRRNWN